MAAGEKILAETLQLLGLPANTVPYELNATTNPDTSSPVVSAPGRPSAKSAEVGSEEVSEAGSEENTISVSANGVEADGVQLQSEGSRPRLESAFSLGAKSKVLEGAQTGAEEEIMILSKQISDEMKKRVDIVDEENKAEFAEKIVPENRESLKKVPQQSDASDVSTFSSLSKKAVPNKSESSEESEATTTKLPAPGSRALSHASLSGQRIHSALSSEPHPLEESHLPISGHVLASGNVSGNMSGDFQRVDAVMAHIEQTGAEHRAALLEEVLAAGGQIRKRARMERTRSGCLTEAKCAKECGETLEERTNKEAGNTTGDVTMDVDVGAPAAGGANLMGTTTGGGPRLKQITSSLVVALSMDEDTVMRTVSLEVAVQPEVVIENVSASPSPTGGSSSLPVVSDAHQEQAEGKWKSQDSDKHAVDQQNEEG